MPIPPSNITYHPVSFDSVCFIPYEIVYQHLYLHSSAHKVKDGWKHYSYYTALKVFLIVRTRYRQHGFVLEPYVFYFTQVTKFALLSSRNN